MFGLCGSLSQIAKNRIITKVKRKAFFQDRVLEGSVSKVNFFHQINEVYLQAFELHLHFLQGLECIRFRSYVQTQPSPFLVYVQSERFQSEL